MQDIYDVYEGLHLFNDAMYRATLYIEAVAKSGAFDLKQVEHCRASILKVRSETNLYLIGVIQEVEQRQTNSELLPQERSCQ